jgi:hypothetical protein
MPVAWFGITLITLLSVISVIPKSATDTNNYLILYAATPPN